MDSLRIVLILIGGLVLAAIVLFHKPAGQSKRNHQRWLGARRESRVESTSRRQAQDERLEPSLQPEEPRQSSPSNLAAGLASARLIASDLDAELSSDNDNVTGGSARGQRQAAPDKIVTLYVQRREGRRINGSELLDSAIKAGMEFGEMNIFHRLHEGATEPVFSMADLTAPGHFDPSNWNIFDTSGVTFFMTLPAPISALDAWDAMLATASRMGELLDADVLDDARCRVNRQRIAQLRESMRDYDRRHGLKPSR